MGTHLEGKARIHLLVFLQEILSQKVELKDGEICQVLTGVQVGVRHHPAHQAHPPQMAAVPCHFPRLLILVPQDHLNPTLVGFLPALVRILDSIHWGLCLL